MNTSNAPKRSKLLFFIGTFLFLFGLIFGLVGNSLINSERAYESDGTTAQGTVTGKNIETRSDSDDHNRTSTYYYLKYRFAPPGRESIESSSSVDSTTYQQTSVGATVSVQYLQHDPAQNRIAQQPDYIIGYVFLCIGVLVGGVGLVLFIIEIRQRRLYRRLERDGMMAEATVTAVEPGSLTINGVTQWRLTYTFRDMKGQEVSSSTPHMPPDVARQWNSGDKGKARYDRDNSSLTMWVGK